MPWENWNEAKKIFFQGLVFLPLPSSRHQAHPTARCHCSGGESSLSDVRDSCASFYYPVPRPSPFLRADLVLDGDVIGMKIGRANMCHILSVPHLLLSLVVDLSHLITTLWTIYRFLFQFYSWRDGSSVKQEPLTDYVGYLDLNWGPNPDLVVL